MATITHAGVTYTDVDRITQNEPSRRQTTHTYPGVKGATLLTDVPTTRTLTTVMKGTAPTGTAAQDAIEALQASTFRGLRGDLVQDDAFGRTYPACVLTNVETVDPPLRNAAGPAAAAYRYRVRLTWTQILSGVEPEPDDS